MQDESQFLSCQQCLKFRFNKIKLKFFYTRFESLQLNGMLYLFSSIIMKLEAKTSKLRTIRKFTSAIKN